MGFIWNKWTIAWLWPGQSSGAYQREAIFYAPWGGLQVAESEWKPDLAGFANHFRLVFEMSSGIEERLRIAALACNNLRRFLILLSQGFCLLCV